MTDPVALLRERLARTRDPVERIDLMLDICRGICDVDPSGTRLLAARAVRAAAARNDHVRLARSLATVAQAALFEGDLDAARTALERALPAAEKGGDARVRVMVLAILRDTCIARGELVAAMDHAHRVLEIAEPLAMTETLANCENAIGAIYVILGDYANALEHMHRSTTYFERVNSAAAAITVGNMGGVYCDLGELDRAEAYLQQAIAMARAGGHRRAEMLNMGLFGFNALEQGRVDEGLTALTEALSASREFGLRIDEVELLRGVAIAMARRGDLEAALIHAREGYELAKTTSHNRGPAILAHIGKYLIELGRHVEARDILLDALAFAEAMNNGSTIGFAHELMAECLEHLGDSAGSLAHYKAFIRIREATTGREQQKKVTQLEMRREIERATAERERLRADATRLAEQMEQMKLEMTAMSLHLVEKNEFLDTLKREMHGMLPSVDDTLRPTMRGLLRALDGNIATDEQWQMFGEQFELVNPGFLDRLARRHPKLTRTELKICTLLKLQLSTKQIADVMATAPKTVEIHRYRIRKKLGLSVEQTFASAFADI